MLRTIALLLLITSSIVCAETAPASQKSEAVHAKPEPSTHSETAKPTKSEEKPAVHAEPEISSKSQLKHLSEPHQPSVEPSKPEPSTHSEAARPTESEEKPEVHYEPETDSKSQLKHLSEAHQHPIEPSKPAPLTPTQKINSCHAGFHWVWTSVSNLEGGCQKNNVGQCVVYDQVYGKCVACESGFTLSDNAGSVYCRKTSLMKIIMAVLICLMMVVVLMVVRTFNQSRAASADYYAPKMVNAEPYLVSKSRFPEPQTPFDANSKKNEAKRQELEAQMDFNP